MTRLPDPKQARVFRFCGFDFRFEDGSARLSYAFDDGPELIETVRFPNVPAVVSDAQKSALHEALYLLHLIAGVSYYKAGIAPRLQVETAAPAGALVEFLNRLYVDGLSEFAYRNQIDLYSRVNWYSESTESGSGPVSLPPVYRSLVALGGGKDSLVSVERLKHAGEDMHLACVGSATLIEQTAAVADLPFIRIQRQLAPELSIYNADGAYNGHVPITAINSAILTCAAILYGFDHIVFSNERSASVGNLVTEDGATVNHQFSKSWAFERSFAALLRGRVSADLHYYSLLRPWSELAVIAEFSRLRQYHSVFSSCNRNFHQDGSRIASRWCADCPKCRFACLGLALFLSPAEVSGILGANLLNNPAQLAGFRELCGLGAHKPFECVGEIEESRSAFLALAGNPAWCDTPVVGEIAKDLREFAVSPLDDWMKPAGPHAIPGRIGVECYAAD